MSDAIYTSSQQFLLEKYPEHGAMGQKYNSDFIYAIGNPSQAVLYAALFVPEIVDVHGYALLVLNGDSIDNFSEHFEQTKKKNGKMVGLADSFNFVELPYAFTKVEEPLEVYDILYEFVAEAWRGRLAYLFPERRFKVYIQGDDDEGNFSHVGFAEIGGPGS